jgi:hypothetical protein
LSPELEAFAASIQAAKPNETAEFARWRRRRLPSRLLVVLVGVVLMAPGLVSFVIQAPWWLSLGLETAGLIANGWLRQERRRQAAAIAAWAPEAHDP